MSRLTNEIMEVNKLSDAINEVASQLKKSEGNKTQEFVSIKSAEKVTMKAEKQQFWKTPDTISFSADQDIKTFLQQILTFDSVSNIKTCTTDKTDTLYKVKSRREIDVKLTNDISNCNIVGSCLTEDGSLVLLDFNNKKLKRLDMSTETIKDYLDFQAQPRALCLVSKTETAVTLNNSSVQFVSLGNKLTATLTLTVNHQCYGLVHIGGMLFISDAGNNVYIHDVYGRELKRISTDDAGKPIFKNTRYITISSGGDRVFVADFYKGVIILDIQGNYLSTLTDPTLAGSRGVCTAGRNLFVCGFYLGNIVQIGQDYRVKGELWKTKDPFSLCFDDNKNRLIVTCNKDNITMFELE